MQQQFVGIPQVLAPLETVPFCWDAPSRVCPFFNQLHDVHHPDPPPLSPEQKHEITVELTSTNFVHSYNLDQVKLHKERRTSLLNAAPIDGQEQEIVIQAEVNTLMLLRKGAILTSSIGFYGRPDETFENNRQQEVPTYLAARSSR